MSKETTWSKQGSSGRRVSAFWAPYFKFTWGIIFFKRWAKSHEPFVFVLWNPAWDTACLSLPRQGCPVVANWKQGPQCLPILFSHSGGKHMTASFCFSHHNCVCRTKVNIIITGQQATERWDLRSSMRPDGSTSELRHTHDTSEVNSLREYLGNFLPSQQKHMDWSCGWETGNIIWPSNLFWAFMDFAFLSLIPKSSAI